MTRQWKISMLSLLCILCAATVIHFSKPGESPWLPNCPFHQLTGLHCPGCGMTRSVHALTHMRFREFFHDNILALPLGIFLIYSLARPKYALTPTWGYAILAIAIIFMALRNIPAYPFTLLAPIQP